MRQMTIFTPGQYNGQAEEESPPSSSLGSQFVNWSGRLMLKCLRVISTTEIESVVSRRVSVVGLWLLLVERM